MKSHVLDYVFKFHRQKIQSNKADKTKLEDYIYDLENTWSINTEILISMIDDNKQFTSENKKHIFIIIERIKDLVNKKKYLRENKMKIRSKLLMDNQIMEEYKRRNEENNAYYTDQMEEHKENLEKKESFIKQFIKKFTEVETYIQREAKCFPMKWEHLENFEIVTFINSNESLHKKKLSILEEIESIREDMNVILKENVELKKRDEYIDISDDNYDDHKTKFISLLNNYKSKIKYFERNNDNLKNVLSNLQPKWDKFNSISMFRYNRPLVPHQRNISLSVPGHKKINSKAEIFFKELDLVTQNNELDKSNNNNIIEEVNEHNEENGGDNDANQKDEGENQGIPQVIRIMYEDEDEGEDMNNKIGLLNISQKDESILNNNDQSIFNRNVLNRNRSDFTLNREQWDISCIENI